MNKQELVAEIEKMHKGIRDLMPDEMKQEIEAVHSSSRKSKTRRKRPGDWTEIRQFIYRSTCSPNEYQIKVACDWLDANDVEREKVRHYFMVQLNTEEI